MFAWAIYIKSIKHDTPKSPMAAFVITVLKSTESNLAAVLGTLATVDAVFGHGSCTSQLPGTFTLIGMLNS